MRKNSRIRVPIEGSEQPILKGKQLRKPQPQQYNAVTPAPQAEMIEITLRVRAKSDRRLQKRREQLMARSLQQQPTQQAASLRDTYGAASEDMKRVAKFARDNQLTVIEEDPVTRSVIVKGTRECLEDLFGVELLEYEHKGSRCRAHTGPIGVPEEIADLIEHVLGLDTLPLFAHPSNAPSLAPKFTPAELAALYGFPNGKQGLGQRIGILSMGGGFHERDLRTFFERPHLALQQPSIRVVGENRPHSPDLVRKALALISGGANRMEQTALPPGSPTLGEIMWTIETTMDLELIGALANAAEITVYFTEHSSTVYGLIKLLQKIFNEASPPQVLSLSFGRAEADFRPLDLQHMDEALQTLAERGITVCCCSGDYGASKDFGSPEIGVVYPGSSPFVLSCGGTYVHAEQDRIDRETVWNSRSYVPLASGGGVSRVFSLPAWQRDVNVAGKTDGTSMRGVPDIAADADPTTGCLMHVAGEDTSTSGTSASAPLWAALIARINVELDTQLGYFNPLLYGHPSIAGSLRDVTEGDNKTNNCGYAASTGWDPCTGWGAPDGAALCDALKTVLHTHS